ncbi:MAG: ABC transporter permease [Microbacterium sp.]|nr:MAG: ABC transporter permease [Microbacterium sp.]
MSLVRATSSELTKQFTTSMWWILGIVLFLYVGVTAAGIAGTFGALASGAIGPEASTTPPPPADGLPPLIYSLATSVGYVFPLLLGALLVTGEFRHQTLTPTFLATPRRGIALGGKVIAGAVVGVLYAVIGIAASVGAGAGLLAAFGIETQIGAADTWALIGRMVIAFVLWTLIGIGVGTLVRNQVATIVGVLAFTQFVEPILRVVGGFVDGLSSVTRYLPGAASDALVGSSFFGMFGGAGGVEPLEWWVGGLLLLGYAAVFLLLGWLFSWRRDVS